MTIPLCCELPGKEHCLIPQLCSSPETSWEHCILCGQKHHSNPNSWQATGAALPACGSLERGSAEEDVATPPQTHTALLGWIPLAGMSLAKGWKHERALGLGCWGMVLGSALCVPSKGASEPSAEILCLLPSPAAQSCIPVLLWDVLWVRQYCTLNLH